ncbi:E3 ubiquitin-protein ligase TRIM71 [Exaiptasia diaphana]|uniref:Uncharacterized protein n=1 Tax=Exaiptasia diaphana TaxID=2652724 RepID=A0A913Y2I7_EXADI|nr:E3 ubiquitin-protein ligase TRIM71 [Exaiptasia diaphana]KXJ19837.1 E3 ubiquitin-protein ligase TRIM71 [Exaiptasia diaphana]
MDIQSLLENLEELLTCRHCSNIFRKPKITPCLHSFCCECLNEIASSRPYQGFIECPVCQYEIKKPEGGRFESLPSSFFLHRLLDVFVAKRRSYSDASCGNCHRNLVLSSFCFSCNVFMCEECFSAHHVITRNNAHRTVALGRLKQKDYEELFRRSTFCAHKFNEKGIVEYFCYDCDACVCHVCNVAIQHKHQIVDIDEAAKDQKMKLRDVNAKLKTKLKSVELGISNVEFRSIEVQDQIDYTKKEIRSKIGNMIDILKKHEEDMLQEVERIRKDKQENLTFQLKMYETMHKQTKSSIEFTEGLIERNLSEEILTIKNHVLERARAINSTYVGTNPAENERVGYVANTKAFEAIQKEFLGHISTSLTEPAVCNAEGNGIMDVSAGEEVYFTVTTRNAQGEVYYSEIDHVVAAVKSDLWGDIEASVKNYQDGRYEVSYIPRVPGNHKIQVEVSGEHIDGSPFVVSVKQPVLTPVKSFGSHGKKAGSLLQPHGVATNTIGQIVLSDSLKHQIQVYTSDGTHMLDFGEEGFDDGQFMHPMSIAFDNSERFLFATDSDNNRIQVFDVKAGRFSRKFGTEGNGPGQFNGPCGISIDNTDRVIVTDWSNHRIQVFTIEGKFLFKFGDRGSDRLAHPRCAIYHEKENCFVVSDTGNNVLKVFDSDGKFSHIIGRPGQKRGELRGPRGLAIDKDKNIVVCDFENHRLQFFKIDGTVLNSFGARGKGIGQFAFPLSVSITGGGARVVVSDWGNNRIQIFKSRDENSSPNLKYSIPSISRMSTS